MAVVLSLGAMAAGREAKAQGAGTQRHTKDEPQAHLNGLAQIGGVPKDGAALATMTGLDAAPRLMCSARGLPSLHRRVALSGLRGF